MLVISHERLGLGPQASSSLSAMKSQAPTGALWDPDVPRGGSTVTGYVGIATFYRGVGISLSALPRYGVLCGFGRGRRIATNPDR